MDKLTPSLLILGTRGVPAMHGGFETFAERLALYLAERGWRVGVYCQNEVDEVRNRVTVEKWQGVDRLIVEVSSRGPLATLEFDWHCVRDAARRDGVCLVLGYNGAVFLPYLRLLGRNIITNMDGIEWRRAKWSLPVKGWFWVNEWIAAWTSHRLVADHPAIAAHLATRRPRSAIALIPYGGDPIVAAPESGVTALGLDPGRYLVSIARIEPENNILTIVEAFSRRARGIKLAVLGNLDKSNAYHQAVLAAAGNEVVFAGAIYDKAVVQALRFHARAYVHGHSVGGTNPSLVEALWAGNAVIAHDNVFNRWTAGAAGLFFDSVESCDAQIDRLLSDDVALARCQSAARVQAAALFKWPDVLATYGAEFLALAPGRIGYVGHERRRVARGSS